MSGSVFKNIIFMGSPDFSVPTLSALMKHNYPIKAVYCQAPKPAHRGQKLFPCAVHQFAQEKNLSVFTPKSLKKEDALQVFLDLKPDLVVVVAYGLILPKEIIHYPTYGCLNVHASLLPRWRGAAPIHRAIQSGDKETGITIMRMDEGLDTGDMILKTTTPIDRQETSKTLHDRLSIMGADALIEALKLIEDNKVFYEKQDDGLSTYAKKLNKPEGQINWTQSAHDIENHIRAFDPWPGTWCVHNEKAVLKIIKASVLDITSDAEPGTIIQDPLIIASGDKAIKIEKIQRAGKKIQTAEEFLRGYPLKKGDSLLTKPI